jgi:hypothetical protein
MNLNHLENNQHENSQRIYELVTNFLNNNYNNLFELLNLNEEVEPCLMFNIIRSFTDELYNVNDFDICLEIYFRKLRQLRDEVTKYNNYVNNYVNNHDNINNHIHDIWQTTKTRYSTFRRTLYVYINFAILDHININVNEEMIDNIYNQINENQNENQNQNENENQNNMNMNNNIIH